MSVLQKTAVPYVGGLPVVGVIPHLIRKDPLEYLTATIHEHGDLFALKLGPEIVYVITAPQYFQRILRDNHHNYIKPDLLYKAVRPIFGNGLVLSEGDLWLRQRRMIQPHLHRRQLRSLIEIMVQSIGDALIPWQQAAEQGTLMEAKDEMIRITSEVLIHATFGTESLTPTEFSRVSHAMDVMVKHAGVRGYLPFLPDWVRIPGDKHFDESLRSVREIVMKLIQRLRQEGYENHTNLMAMLLGTVDAETNEQMTNEQLFDEAMTIFVAGFETVATALNWVLYTLNSNPEVKARVQEEIDTVLQGRDPAFEDLPRLSYTRSVLLETMRIYTPVPMVVRQSVEADRLGDFELPAGALVLIYFYGLHHNPDVWPEPERFDPERFSPQQEEKRHPFAFLPFSGGPRKCVGDEFALTEAPTALAMMMQRFDVQIAPGQNIKPKLSTALLAKDGINFQVRRRD